MTARAPILLLLLVAACAPDGPPPPPPPGDASAPPPEATTPAPADPWAVTEGGAGPARIGMPLAELEPLLAGPVDTAAAAGNCGYVRLAEAPDSMLFMIDGGRLVRIDVTGGTAATAQGARVGDAEPRVRELYLQLREQPHKYTDGRYLIALPDAPGDTLYRIVFETDGERVTRYRAGIYPQVEWVEGCS